MVEPCPARCTQFCVVCQRWVYDIEKHVETTDHLRQQKGRPRRGAYRRKERE